MVVKKIVKPVVKKIVKPIVIDFERYTYGHDLRVKRVLERWHRRALAEYERERKRPEGTFQNTH